MNKQALYSAIMEKVAIQVKKAINEADSNVSKTFMTDEEVMGLIDPELIITDDDGTTYINLDDLSVLPKEIIDEMVFEIIQTGEIYEADYDGYSSSIYYELDVTDDSPILLRSADYHEITVEAEVDFEITVDHYYPGRPATYYDPPEYPELELSDEITVYDVKLSDGGNNTLDIDDEDVITTIQDDLDGSELEQKKLETFEENYEEDDEDDEDRWRDDY